MATTLVFFPGALVDPRAYAPLARFVAAAGYPVVIVELPRRGAFGGADSPELAARIRSVLTPDSSARIVVGGHSRGAVVASRVAAENAAKLSGLAIIGSSHPRDHDLSSLRIPVTKIVGTRDGLATPREVRQNARLLPAQTRWIWIEGGNHSQFGWYGLQPLDRRPRINATRQRKEMIEGVLHLLRSSERRTEGDLAPGERQRTNG
jgi:pimeloyl-ACP methyl ester carboxylesterase